MVEFVGLSGPVKFDTSGLRTQFQLDLMELHMDGLVMMMMMMMIIVTLRKMISMKVKMLTTFAADRQLLAQVKTIFRSARTSCTTFGWSVRPVRPVRPVRKKNLDHLYTGIYAL